MRLEPPPDLPLNSRCPLMKTRKRLTKRQLKRDRFVETTFDWAAWTRANARTVAIGVGALVLLAGGMLLYQTSRSREARMAGQRFQEVWTAYAAGNYQLAANDFKQFRDQYGGSEYADDASLYLGDSYLRAGDYPAAIKTLEQFRRDYDDSPLTYGATSLLAAAYEGSGNLVKAAEIYAEALRLARHDYQRVASLMDGARVLEGQQKKSDAAGAYRQIVEKYPDSDAAAEARVRLAELTAKPLALSRQATAAARAAVAADTASTGEPRAPATGSASAAPAALRPGAPTPGQAPAGPEADQAARPAR